MTEATTYNLYGGETNRVIIECININKTLVGTVTVKAGATTIAIFAIGTLAGTYFQTSMGVEVEAPSVILSSASDNVTTFYRNA